MDNEYIIEARNLKQYFNIRHGLTIKAVDDVSFGIRPGEVYGLVGESGCGKSTIAKTMCGIYTPTEGQVLYDGIPVSSKGNRKHQTQIIFQDSAAALNPRMKIIDIVSEPLIIQGDAMGKSEREDLVVDQLKAVGLESEHLYKLPGELSGGQRQRVAIARSLIVNPRLIIADEPIASLDISIQAQIINLFKELQQERGFSLLFIAHDLLVVKYISNRIGVMYKGKLVETGDTEAIFSNPTHDYTKELLSAVLSPI